MVEGGILNSTTQTILENIREDGFCVVHRAIDTDTAARLNAIIEQLREREARDYDHGLEHQRVLALAAKHPAFMELMCHPLAVALFDQMLGADFICSTWTSNTLNPGFDEIYWHVDHPYWTIEPPYPVDLPLTAHAIWCLDDYTHGSGSTLFVPGSHKRPRLPEHNSDHSAEAVAIEAPAGSVIFAHGAIWHSPGRNTSDAARTAVFGRYACSFIIPQEDLRHQLATLKHPSALVRRLMGGDQYIPQRGLPY